MATSERRRSRVVSTYQYFVYQTEPDYQRWLTRQRVWEWLSSLYSSELWNIFICLLILTVIVILSLELTETNLFELFQNIIYALHCLALLCHDIDKIKYDGYEWKVRDFVLYFIDLVSFLPFLFLFTDLDKETDFLIDKICYYVRLHRPFRYLWDLNHRNLKWNVLGTLMKYLYILTVLRLMLANLFLWINIIDDVQYENPPDFLHNKGTRMFFRSIYVIYKLFIPMGIDTYPSTDLMREFFMVVVVVSSLMVTGITVATLSVILSIYMRPEEAFRSRFRLIMNEMKETQVPEHLSEKVETFYRMFWFRQKAVSEPSLIKLFPHTLVSNIQTNMYFEAQQKTRMLCDLTYHFLSEIAKYMNTVHYVPGDTIMKRNSVKNSIIYVSYGDVEMVTPEDDETPTMRFTRGTILNPCGGSIEVATTRAHVTVRAATFCSAHILDCSDLWRVVFQYGNWSGQSFLLRYAISDHLQKVKRHYEQRDHPEVLHKSTILMLKRNLMDLKAARDENGKLLMDRSDYFIKIAGCYSMRNRTDSSITDETDPICLRSTFPCILQPHSSFLTTWNIFVAIFAFLSAIIRPYSTVYFAATSAEYQFFYYMVLIIFLVDIVVRLSTGSKIEEGAPISFTQTATEQLRNYWIAFDILSVIPMGYQGVDVIFKLPRVFKLLKHLEDACVYQSSTLRFLSLCLFFILLCFLLASYQQDLMCKSGFCILKNFTHEPFWEKKPIDNGPVENRLVFSLYWSMSLITFTSHKTALITKVLWVHQLFVLMFIEICTVLHLMVEATYSATIMVSEKARDEFMTCITTVKKFLVKNNVDKVIQHRFSSYLQLCWYTDRAFFITNDEVSIWFDLPEHVYQEILSIQRSKYVLTIPFMKYLSNNDLKNVASKAYLFHTSPNEILLNTGDISNEIYVIKRGFCEIVDPITKNVVSLIGTKRYFGDLECLLRIPAYYTVRAVTHVQLFIVSRKHLKNAIEQPNLKDAIHFAKQQPEYKLLQRCEKPFLKYIMPQQPPNKVLFPLPRKHESDNAFLHPFYRIGFLSFLRYVFPRFAIRPDGKYLKRYEWFRAAAALVAANIFPLYSFLEEQFPILYYITLFLDTSAMYDVIQRMLVAYYNEKGILVYHPSSTAAHYLKGAFVVDLMGCLPMEYLDSTRRYNFFKDDAYKHPSMYQYLMYNRLLQLYRVPSALEALNDSIVRQDIILIIRALPLFMALLVVSTSLMLEFSVEQWVPVTGGWRLKPIPTNNSWIDIFPDAVRYNITETPLNLVLTAFYWIVYETTTTGFDVFQPTTTNLIYVLIPSMLIGKLLTTFFTVRIISIRSNVNRALAEYQGHLKDIVDFMNTEKLNHDLQKEVVLFYEYMWDKTGGTEYRSVLKLCEQITLRTDAILHIYGATFSKCPILNRCDLPILRVVGRAVHSVYFHQSLSIIESNDIITYMYFIHRGTIGVELNYGDHFGTVKLHRGSVFGNLEATKTAICSNKFVALTNVHLLKISTEGFYSIIQDFPSIKLMIKKYRAQHENFIRGIVSDEDKYDTFQEDHKIKVTFSSGRQKIFTILKSHSKQVQIYLIVVSMMCVYGDTYNASFQNASVMLFIILSLLDLCFYMKIAMNYYFPNVIEEESLTKKALETSWKRYYKTEFKYDIFSCVPFEIFCIFFNDPVTMFCVLRLNRVFRVVTVYRCLGRYHEKLSINLTITTIATVFIWFTLFLHIVSCLWYIIGVRNDRIQPRSSWRYNGSIQYKMLFYHIPISFYTDDGSGLCDENYICATYFVLTTFTQNGVGDILPKQPSEVAFVCLLMIVSTMLYIIYMGEFSNIIQYQYFRHFSFFSKYLELQGFLNNNRVAKNLIKLTHKYTLILWKDNRGLQMPHFLVNAPDCLRLKLMSAAYMHHLLNHPVFKDCEPAFLRQLVGCLELYLYDREMFVVKEGEITDAMYFIHQGHVEEYDEDFEDRLDVLGKGECFGAMIGLKHGEAYSYSYKTMIKSQILTLSIKDWEHLLKHFPKSKETIFKSFGPLSSTPRLYSQNEIKKRMQRKMSTPRTVEKSRSALYVQGPSLPQVALPYTIEETDEEGEQVLGSTQAPDGEPSTSKDLDEDEGMYSRIYRLKSSAIDMRIRDKSRLKFEILKIEDEEESKARDTSYNVNASKLTIKDMITQMREKNVLNPDVLSSDTSSKSLQAPVKSFEKSRVNFELDRKSSTNIFFPPINEIPTKSALKINVDVGDSREEGPPRTSEDIELKELSRSKRPEEEILEHDKIPSTKPQEAISIPDKEQPSTSKMDKEVTSETSSSVLYRTATSIATINRHFDAPIHDDKSKLPRKAKVFKRLEESKYPLPPESSSTSEILDRSGHQRPATPKKSLPRLHDSDLESDVGATTTPVSSSSSQPSTEELKKEK